MRSSEASVLGLILKGYPRISETFISNEILLLEQLGFHIRLFSMRRPRENFAHDSVAKIMAGVDYLPETFFANLPRFVYRNLRLAANRPGLYRNALKTAYRRFLRTHKLATIKHLFQAGFLVQKLLPVRPIIHLHAHFAHSPASVAMFCNQLSGLPFSFTAHAKDIYTSDPDQLREKINAARFVVTCTEYNRRYLAELVNGQGPPVYRVYHGVDTRLFESDDVINQNPTPPYRILTVARMTAKKGLPTVYRALGFLQKQGVALQHILIGDGDDRRAIQSLIKELDLSSTSRWLGTQPHHVVLDHYRRADLFVLGCEVAKNGDRDGIPNVLLESMAMGVPVVATDISAIPELVENEKTGLLVPPGRPERLAESMLRMLTDRELRQKVIPAAKDKVRDEFDNRALIKDLANIYRRHVTPKLADK